MVNSTTNRNSLLRTSYTPGQIEFIRWVHAHRTALTVYDECTVSRDDLIALLHSDSVYIAVPAWIASDKLRRAGRGNYLIPEMNQPMTWLNDPTLVNNNTRGRKAGSKNVKGRPPVVPVVATTNTSRPSDAVLKAFPAPKIGNVSGAGIGIVMNPSSPSFETATEHEPMPAPTPAPSSRIGNTTQGIGL